MRSWVGARGAWSVAFALWAVAGCGGGGPAGDVDAAGTDAGQDGGTSCACDDHVFCNGVETCNADGSCRAGTSPCTAGQTCDEAGDRCSMTCTTDADADGAIATSCGGTDCDDGNPAIGPDRMEVCDAAGVDEDCDPTTFGMRDADDDGYQDAACCNGATCGDDCDDTRPTSHPTAPEVCDMVDQDCDSAIDEAVQATVYVDTDGDGYGTGAAVQRCADTAGYSPTAGDCDDTEPLANPAVPEVCDGIDNDCDGTPDDGAQAVSWYEDADGDGFGSATTEPVTSCAAVTGHVPRAGDCNDTDRAINPGAVERCNGRDDNCNGVADFRIGAGNFEDDDGDGAPDAMCPGGTGNDCNDTDPNIGPTVPELCGDTTDNDCDGTVDEAAGMSTWYLDADMDGFGDPTSAPITACSPQAGRSFRTGDCDDANPDIHPSQLDGCDGVNADCDAQFDEDGVRYAFYADGDMDGYGAGSAVFACVGPMGTANRGGDCADADPSRHPDAMEDCNGRDDDCDGHTDEGAVLMTFHTDADRDGHGVAAGPTRMGCVPPAGFAVSIDDCDDTNPGRYPGATELCDGIDQNCDGTPDGAEANASCVVAHGAGICSAGFCEVSACMGSYADCDASFGTGCEVDTSTDPNNCGGCGASFRCDAGLGCTSSACEVSPITQVEAGGIDCALRANGRVVCWGDLGSWFPTSGPFTSTSRFAVPGITNAVQISVGNFVACATLASGQVSCWGRNMTGGLGRGDTGDGQWYAPAIVAGIADAVEVSCSNQTSGPYATVCARRANGRVVCWGHNGYGELGDPGTVEAAVGHPVVVAGVTSAVQVDVGNAAVCARRSDGTVLCWGAIGTISGPTATAMPGVTGAIDVDTMLGCAATSSGVSCLGELFGGMGAASYTLAGTTGVEIAHVGSCLCGESSNHAVCLQTAAGAQCVGRGDSGQLGRGSSPVQSTTLATVSGLGAHTSLDAGENHFCAIRNGVPVCWGLGYGNVPTIVSGL